MSEDQALRPCRVRHYVLATPDQDFVCQQLYDFLGLTPTPKREGPSPTAAFGFSTAMMRVGTTLIEVVQPLRKPHLLHSFFDSRGGQDGGFMVVMQTYDADALRARAGAAGLKFAMDMDFRGQRLMQFDHKDFGTRFEFYKYTPEENWWGDPLNGPYSDSPLAEEIVGAEVAVERPAEMAATAAEVFIARQEGQAIVCVDDRRIDFVAPTETRLRGLNAIYLKARDRSRVGDMARIANVDFKLV